MNRDPLYRKIVEALARPPDGNVFEQCAVAIIGKAHPNLAPMRGGDDAGMDGAFGTPDGPFPLICTVQEDVIGNFRDNISTYLRKCNGPRRASIATSQFISNAKKRNLDEEAQKLGVVITNIYDAPYFADQLYRDAKWRLELLGVTGDPSALSALPLVGRFAQPEILIGRDEDLAWIKQVQGDALLVGQPGSGKTYLHQYLANQDFCLFAVDADVTKLADAIREQEPSVIVVDDAHICLKLVEDLKRLRADLGVSYDIHLNCWPRHESSVQRILDIPETRVRHLRLLRRKEIFEIIERLGIRGPNWLQHLLISQADGKPGLAVALAELCKNKAIAEIWSGEAAARQLLGDSRLVPTEQERCVLAAFSVGGDSGVSFKRVSAALGLSVVSLREMITRLGSGGLVEEVTEDRLQVRPAILRPVLVRDVFYGGATSPSIAPLLEGIRYFEGTAGVLLGARQRGAMIELDFLEQIVRAADTCDTWEHFAWVDEKCATVILDKYPEQVCSAAPGLLNYYPTRTLHLLLDADTGESIRQGETIQQPRSRVARWLFTFDAAPGITIERRRMLLDVLEERARQNRLRTGMYLTWALTEILQVRFDETRLSPGNDREFRSIRGVVSHAVIEQIVELWPRVRELFRLIPNSAVRPFFDHLEWWCLPQRLSLAVPISEQTHEMVKASGRMMLLDVLAMPQCNRAWRTHALRLAKWAEFDLSISVDPTFDALYADRDHSENWQEEHQRRIAELQEFTKQLIQCPREKILQFLTDIRAEALEFGHRNGSGYLWVVYHFIAQNCKDPAEWFALLIARMTPSEFVMYFVDRLEQGDCGQFESALERLLERAEYRPLAISRVLRQTTQNERLVSIALDLLNDPGLLENFGLRNSDLTVPVMTRLLDHPKSKVRATAAIGEWQLDPPGSVRPELQALWRRAVRDVKSDHYALKEIFETDPALAFEWLRAHLQSENRDWTAHDVASPAAADILNRDQRAELLRLFTRKNYSDECFDRVIGEHVDLFAGWLRCQSDDALRLRPLDRDIGPRWEQMAVLALDAGVSPEELAEHCTSRSYGFGATPLSQRFLSRIPAYEALANHTDPRLRTVGKRGLEEMQHNARAALARERQAEIYGD